MSAQGSRAGLALAQGRAAAGSAAPIGGITAGAYTIPTDAPEADGTLAWDRTTLVLAELSAGGVTGLGYSYTAAAAAGLIRDTLAPVLEGMDAMDPPAAWDALQRAVRNLGRSGLAACAISALDIALWDAKAKLLGLPLALLLGRCRDAVPIYGSGGFTSYADDRLRAQLAGWVEQDGCAWVKMKIGSDPARDRARARAARQAIGDHGLFVDANGAFGVREALRMAAVLAAEADVAWFEEPVSSDDLAGLHRVRAGAPDGMDIAAGEYAYTADDVRHMLCAGAVDVQQADITRCCGVTGFLRAASQCAAHHTDLSAHCGPAAHLHAACAAPRLRHQEWFHDHVRIEHMLFDGAPVPRDGLIRPDLARPGLGLDFKRQDAERYRA